ncbi:MAG: hypothetical protein WAV00_04965 [Nocardioides sp.]
MSSIRHTVHDHTRVYAAGAMALAVGLLIALMTSVFAGSDTAVSTPGGSDVQGTSRHVGRVYAAPCFEGHPTMSIELARSGCRP